MRSLKREQFVLKVLAAKKVTIDEIVAMTDEEVQELNLSRTVVEVVNGFRARGGVTAEQIAEQIADIMEQPETVIIPEIVDEYKIEEDAESEEIQTIALDADEQTETLETDIAIIEPEILDESITTIINEVVEATVATTEEIEAAAAKFGDKTAKALTKKVKLELGDKDVDLTVLRDIIKAQVLVNKGK